MPNHRVEVEVPGYQGEVSAGDQTLKAFIIKILAAIVIGIEKAKASINAEQKPKNLCVRAFDKELDKVGRQYSQHKKIE